MRILTLNEIDHLMACLNKAKRNCSEYNMKYDYDHLLVALSKAATEPGIDIAIIEEAE